MIFQAIVRDPILFAHSLPLNLFALAGERTGFVKVVWCKVFIKYQDDDDEMERCCKPVINSFIPVLLPNMLMTENTFNRDNAPKLSCKILVERDPRIDPFCLHCQLELVMYHQP